jgi:hypothetical protein
MAVLNTKTNNATGELIHHDENPIRSQRCGFTAEQIAAPQTVLHVAEECQPGWEPDFRCGAVQRSSNKSPCENNETR